MFYVQPASVPLPQFPYVFRCQFSTEPVTLWILGFNCDELFPAWPVPFSRAHKLFGYFLKRNYNKSCDS